MLDPGVPEFWLGYADNSYVATRLLWFTGQWVEAPVSAHRTLELYLKAFLVSHGEEVRPRSQTWGHVLSDLGTACKHYSLDFANEDVHQRLKYFQRYFDFVRYPSEPGSPADGSLVWFSFDSNIQPLDELTAFIRPRVRLEDACWLRSSIRRILNSEEKSMGFQRRALTDTNGVISQINCSTTDAVEVLFKRNFNYDLPGC